MPQHPNEDPQQPTGRPAIGLGQEEQFDEFAAAMSGPLPSAESVEGDEEPGEGGLIPSTIRGVQRAAVETTNGVLSLGRGILKHTQAYKLFGDDEWDQEWMEWYQQDIEEANPVHRNFDPGARAEGLWGFYEAVVELGSGFLAAGPAVRGTKFLAQSNPFVRGMVQGGIADLSVIGAHEEGVFDMLEQAPEPFRTEAFSFMAKDEDDPQIVGRLKNVAEGMLLGGVFEGIFAGLKLARASRMAREGSTEAAQREANEALQTTAAISRDADRAAREAEAENVLDLRATKAVEEAAEQRRGPRRRLAEAIDPTLRADQEAAILDELTGVRNRDAWQRAKPRLEEDPLTEIVMIDVRNLHGFNEAEGMEAADEFLKGVANTLRRLEIDERSIFRSGGDEFVVAAPAGQGQAVGQAIEEAVGVRPIAGRENMTTGVRYGVGQTFSEADAAATAKKPLETGERARPLGEAAEEAPPAAGPAYVPETGKWEVVLTRPAADAAEGAGPTRLEFDSASEATKVASSANLVHRMFRPAVRQANEVFQLSADQRMAVEQVKERLAEGIDPQDAERLTEGINFNFGNLGSSEEQRILLNALSEALQDTFEKATKIDGLRPFSRRNMGDPGQANAETLEIAARWMEGEKPEVTLSALADFAGVTEAGPQLLTAARMLMDDMSADVVKMADAVDLDPTNAVAVRGLLKKLDGLAGLAKNLAGANSNIGRSLQALSIDISDEAVEAARKAAREAGEEGPIRIPDAEKSPVSRMAMAKRMSAREIGAMARTLSLTDGDQASLLRALRLYAHEARRGSEDAFRSDTWQNKLVSFRAAMMLSGPRTHATNFISSLTTAIQLPVEIMIGGVRTRNAKVIKQGADMLIAPFTSNGGKAFWIFREALSGMKRAWKGNRSVLDPRFSKDDLGALRPIDGESIEGFWSNVLHAPGRALIAGDEFVKRMAYLSHVRGQSIRKSAEFAERTGTALDGKAIQRRLSEDYANAIDGDGAALWANSLQHARTSTFTQKLRKGSVGRTLQDAANQHVGVRLLMPFVRTPANIVDFAWQRIPGLRRFNPELRDMLKSGDPDLVAQAQGRIWSGNMVTTAGLLMAHNGIITGGGPSDPALRKQMLDAGWQPYSIKMGDQWINYRRLEPFSTPMALMADAVEAMGEMEENDAMEVVTALMAGMAASVSSKTFLVGMVDFFDAIGSGETHAVEQFRNSMGVSFTPALARQFKEGAPEALGGDEFFRNTETFLDNIKRNFPGWSKSLEPRRNIFGEPVMRTSRARYGPMGDAVNTTLNPFTVVDTKAQDEVLMELAELGDAVPLPRETMDDLNLRDRRKWTNRDPERANQSPYDRWMEIVGELGARDAVVRLVQSDTWDNLSDGTDLDPGSKSLAVKRLMRGFQQAARAKMLQEYPDLRRAYGERQVEQGSALVPGIEGMFDTP